MFWLTLILLTSTKWWAPASANKWRMGFNSAFKGLISTLFFNTVLVYIVFTIDTILIVVKKVKHGVFVLLNAVHMRHVG
jgi:hypothetical protein